MVQQALERSGSGEATGNSEFVAKQFQRAGARLLLRVTLLTVQSLLARKYYFGTGIKGCLYQSILKLRSTSK